MLKEEELKGYKRISFPEKSDNDAEYFNFIRKITEIEGFRGVGLENGLLTIDIE